MGKCDDTVVDLLHVFYTTTGIGAAYFDANAELSAQIPKASASLNFPLFGMENLRDFLKKLYTSKSAKENRAFYTYISEFNFFSNIVLLWSDGTLSGSLLSNPVLVKEMDAVEMRRLVSRTGASQAERKRFEKILLETPVVPYKRIMPLGMTLYSLARTSFPDEAPSQVLERSLPSLAARPNRSYPDWEKPTCPSESSRHFPYLVFLKIRGAIQAGDPTALLHRMDGINAGDIPVDQLSDKNFVRSLKDSGIKACALGCYAAVEGNAPYEQAMDLSDEYISQMEALDNIYDICELMKHAMTSFARMVSVRGVPCTKPVVQMMEYMKAHYAEPITLRVLAEYTRAQQLLSVQINQKGNRNVSFQSYQSGARRKEQADSARPQRQYPGRGKAFGFFPSESFFHRV